MNRKPLIAHVLFSLHTGGMERFVVTLINGTGERYRHAVICLDGFGEMRDQIVDTTVPCLSLHKKPGKDWPCYFRLWRALRSLRPDLVQTYNFGALDIAPVAKLAGTRYVLHAERGRDAADPGGKNRKYRYLRRCLKPFIARYLAVSKDLQRWLVNEVGLGAAKVLYIGNGIDPARFVAFPGRRPERSLLAAFAPPGTLLLGTVGRLDPVKAQAGLIAAFRMLCDFNPDLHKRLRLAIAGEGRERANLERQIEQLHLADRVCLLGNRVDVPALLGEYDIFALSSIGEGMPGVLLEAMAAGLPVVATDVGGVREVLADGVTGTLVAPRDPAALAGALRSYIEDEALRLRHGRAGRVRVETQFSLSTMLSAYTDLYDGLLAGDRGAGPVSPSVMLTERREH